jgi:hypothetical protein
VIEDIKAFKREFVSSKKFYLSDYLTTFDYNIDSSTENK